MSFADRGKATSETITKKSPQNQGQGIAPRSVLTLGISIVVLHIVQEAVFGGSTAGSFIAKLLQIFSALLAAATCFAAIRRSSGFTRSFWLLIGLSFVVWTVADLGWMYYESYLHVSPPHNSVFHFMVDGWSLLLAIALLLDQTEESPWYFFDLASVLDNVQLFIVCFLTYLGWYHVPSLHGILVLSMVRSDEIEIGETCAVVVLAILQALRARTSGLRKLYLAFLICFGPLAAGIYITDYRELRFSRGFRLVAGSISGGPSRS